MAPKKRKSKTMDMSGYPMFLQNRSARLVVKADVWGKFEFTANLGESGQQLQKSDK